MPSQETKLELTVNANPAMPASPTTLRFHLGKSLKITEWFYPDLVDIIFNRSCNTEDVGNRSTRQQL